MKKAGRSLPCSISPAGYFLSIEDFLSDDFFLSDFFLSDDFFLLSFLSIFVLLSDFFSVLPLLSCASAAKLVAANIAATRTATSCFMSSPSLVVVGKTGLKERSPSPVTRDPDERLTEAEVVVNQPDSPEKGRL